MLNELGIDHHDRKNNPRNYWIKIHEKRHEIHRLVEQKVLASHQEFVKAQNDAKENEKHKNINNQLDEYIDDELIDATNERKYSARGYYKSGTVVKGKRWKRKNYDQGQRSVKRMFKNLEAEKKLESARKEEKKSCAKSTKAKT